MVNLNTSIWWKIDWFTVVNSSKYIPFNLITPKTDVIPLRSAFRSKTHPSWPQISHKRVAFWGSVQMTFTGEIHRKTAWFWERDETPYVGSQNSYRKSTNRTNGSATMRAEGNWEVGIPSATKERLDKAPRAKRKPVIRSDKIRPRNSMGPSKQPREPAEWRSRMACLIWWP